jgi:hypothetical protein
MAESPDESSQEALPSDEDPTPPEETPASEEVLYEVESEEVTEEGEPLAGESEEEQAQEEEIQAEGETEPEAEQVEYEEETEPAAEEEAGEVAQEEGVEQAQEEVSEGPIAAAGPEVATGDTLLQPCSNCSTMLDVGDLEPFAKVHCPICGTAMRVRTQLKNFTLVEVLGAGGMGAVYKALDTNLNRMVALKVVRKEFSSDAEYLEKFEREARITASVTHPNVVKVYSFGSDHGLFYIAMELVDKGSLDDLMNLQGRVAEIQAVAVGIQVAQGLQAAHQKGLIHRDVKPGNILFADAQTAKIVDFGLALLAAHEAEERGEVWGTPYYVAPEKLDHQPEDFRSDMYSLGGTLFHAIAGRPPFEADTASMVALKHLKSRPVSLQAFAPDVSSATAYVINRTLHKDPDQRYQSYSELIEHLEYARAQLLEAVNRPRRPKQRVVVESKSQQNIFGVITLVLILLILGVGAVLYVYRGSIFGTHEAGTAAGPGATGEDTAATATKMHDQLEGARKQMLAGDAAGAMQTLKDLDDQSDLTQPFQNWITMNEGIAALLQENLSDARGWFRVIEQRSHFSTDPADKGLIDFFTKVGTAMRGANSITPAMGTAYALDSEEALGPFIYGLKDWNISKFEDAGGLFALYLASTPKPPFEWVADYKPIAQKYADDEAAYEKVSAELAAANTPDKRTAALKDLDDLKSKVKGKLAARLDRIEKLSKKGGPTAAPEAAAPGAASSPEASAPPSTPTPAPTPDQAAVQADQANLAAAKQKYAAAVAALRFDDAQNVAQTTVVSTADGLQAKDALLKKAYWLRQFKQLLIQDINAYGYPNPVVTRTRGPMPDGQKKATDDNVLVQTQFGSVPFPWTALSPTQILEMAIYYEKTTATTAPQQAADRQWLAGVFASENGMSQDGQTLLNQAAQANANYKNELGLFPQSQ